MILNEATIKYAGYDPRELNKWSIKRVCKVCDVCGRVRWAQFRSCGDLCYSCAMRTDEHARKISEAKTGHITTAEHRKAIGDAKRGKITSLETRQHMSAGHQGIPYEEWTGFVSNGEYCEKFDEACRERIRKKYNHRCYICDRSQDENTTKNGNVRKLCVHHIDRNKDQGCGGVLWKLIPLCMYCHPGSHRDPVKSRLEYLLNDEDV